MKVEMNGMKLTPEGDGWVMLRQSQRELRGTSPTELLARSRELPGNLRYGLAAGVDVVLLGEVRSRAGEACLEEACARLRRLVHTAPVSGQERLDDEVIEAALDAAGVSWVRREETWAVSTTGERMRELLVQRVPAGVRVEAVLVDWDESGAVEDQAIAQFLCLAQTGLRFARCELSAHSARVVSLAESSHLETDLVHSLGGVALGCRLLAREVGALLVPEMARAFIEFSCVSGAIPDDGQPVTDFRGTGPRAALVGATMDRRV